MMKIFEARERLEVRNSDLSGSLFSDANLSGLRIAKANLAVASISESRLDGMTIDGIAVTDLLAACRAAGQEADRQDKPPSLQSRHARSNFRRPSMNCWF